MEFDGWLLSCVIPRGGWSFSHVCLFTGRFGYCFLKAENEYCRDRVSYCRELSHDKILCRLFLVSLSGRELRPPP